MNQLLNEKKAMEMKMKELEVQNGNSKEFKQVNVNLLYIYYCSYFICISGQFAATKCYLQFTKTNPKTKTS